MFTFGHLGHCPQCSKWGRVAAIDSRLNQRQLSVENRNQSNDRDWGAKPTLWLLYYDPQKRFALWSFLHMFGAAPDLDVAFENDEDREAARNLMDLLAASEGDGAG